jgi:hypothetical protein
MKTYYIAKLGGKQSEQVHTREQIANMLNNNIIHDDHLVLVDGQWQNIVDFLQNKECGIGSKIKKGAKDWWPVVAPFALAAAKKYGPKLARVIFKK